MRWCRRGEDVSVWGARRAGGGKGEIWHCYIRKGGVRQIWGRGVNACMRLPRGSGGMRPCS